MALGSDSSDGSITKSFSFISTPLSLSCKENMKKERKKVEALSTIVRNKKRSKMYTKTESTRKEGHECIDSSSL